MLLNNLEKLYSIDSRGTFGYGGGFGRIVFSYNRFGFFTKFAGIYSRKKIRLGYTSGFGKIIFAYNSWGNFPHYRAQFLASHEKEGFAVSRMRFYRPTNPRTVKQQNWRAVCAYVWTIWATFDPETKEQYRLQGSIRGITGANLFMSEFLKTPYNGYGRMSFGKILFGF